MHNTELQFSQYQIDRQHFWDEVNSRKTYSLGTYYHQRVISTYQNLVTTGSRILEIGCSEGKLLHSLKPSYGLGIDFSSQAIKNAKKQYPAIEFIQLDAHAIDLGTQKFDFIILSELVNDVWDVQAILESLLKYCTAETRIIFNFYSHAWNIPLRILRSLGLAKPNLPQNWLTRHDMENLLEISGYQSLKEWREIIFPIYIPIISNLANRYLAKIWPFELLAVTNFIIARPLGLQTNAKPTVSVIVAARNESGHIAELIERIPNMGSGTEIIFVEGNSTDDTYKKIAEEIKKNPHRDCKLLKQSGKGKGNAVRDGFDLASGDIFMILDADITVPPEDLNRFYSVLEKGYGEVANGVCLVYPMEDDAMRFLNLLGNKFFSWAFSWLLGQSIRDTLCGTKVLWKSDYQKIVKNRTYFGNPPIFN